MVNDDVAEWVSGWCMVTVGQKWSITISSHDELVFMMWLLHDDVTLASNLSPITSGCNPSTIGWSWGYRMTMGLSFSSFFRSSVVNLAVFTKDHGWLVNELRHIRISSRSRQFEPTLPKSLEKRCQTDEFTGWSILGSPSFQLITELLRTFWDGKTSAGNPDGCNEGFQRRFSQAICRDQHFKYDDWRMGINNFVTIQYHKLTQAVGNLTGYWIEANLMDLMQAHEITHSVKLDDLWIRWWPFPTPALWSLQWQTTKTNTRVYTVQLHYPSTSDI